MDPSSGRRRPFSNGLKPLHAAIFLVCVFIRRSYSAPSGGGHDDHGDGHGDGHGGHGEHGYQVFHVEFERVQLPFIISLWIFVSSLAKIGKRRYKCQAKRQRRNNSCGDVADVPSLSFLLLFHETR